MRPSNFNDILSKLPEARQKGDEWISPCPAIGHKTPQGHLNLKDVGDKAVVTCQGGRHSYEDICKALNFDSLVYSGDGKGEPKIVATYDYTDEAGTLLYQVVRYQPKAFRQRRPNGNGGWIWDLKGMRRVIYRLPEVMQAVKDGQTIYISEGEKDVDTLRALGLVATCNPMGAEKWSDSYSEALRGGNLVIIPDNDLPGIKHSEQIARSCQGKARSIRILKLGAKDVSDWLTEGGTREQLEKLASDSPEWKPQPLTNSNRLNLTILTDLIREPEEIVSWLWHQTLPTAGLSLIAAKPKVGKSTLARNLALQVSRGGPFLGRPTNKGAVIYLALEEKRAEVAAHFTHMGAKDEPIFIHTGSAPEEALAALKEAIAEKKAILAIVDPLLRMVRLRDSNDYAEVTRALEPLLMLARDTGCHILAVHHMGKSDREGGDSILGSTALFGAVDTALIMKRRDSMRTLESIQRYGQDIERLALEFDPETGFTQAAGTISEIELKQTATTICDLLGDSESTEAEIRDKVGGNTGLVGKALRWLSSGGYVKREGSGKRGNPYVYFLVSRFSYTVKQQKQEKQGNFRDGEQEAPPFLVSDNAANIEGVIKQEKLDKQDKLDK